MRYAIRAHAMLCARMYAHNTECTQTAVPYYGSYRTANHFLRLYQGSGADHRNFEHISVVLGHLKI